MAFAESVKDQAFQHAGSKCERCGKQLTRHTAQFHHKTSVEASGSGGLSNCEVLCFDCHTKTRSFGG